MRVTKDVAFPGTGDATFGVKSYANGRFWKQQVGSRSIELLRIRGSGVDAVDTIDTMDAMDDDERNCRLIPNHRRLAVVMQGHTMKQGRTVRWDTNHLLRPRGLPLKRLRSSRLYLRKCTKKLGLVTNADL